MGGARSVRRCGAALLVALVGCHGDKVGDYAGDAAPTDDGGLDSTLDSAARDSGHDSSSDSSVADTSADDAIDGALEAPTDTADGAFDDTALSSDVPGDVSSDVPIGDGAPVDSGPLCGTHPGPLMIPVGGSACIDSTEVTVAEYAAFVPAPKTLSARCTGHAFEPGPGGPTAADDPVTGVDWCDAYEYCRWAGKALCGAIAGGPVDPVAFADPAVDLWYLACRDGAAAHVYPYGDAYDAARCNGEVGTSVAPVASHAACNGTAPPFDALFDMSGNAAEWEDACDASFSACQLRGGYFGNAANDLRCGGNNTVPPTMENDEIGFRCCKN